MPRNLLAIAVGMTCAPVLMFPVRLNPFPAFDVAAFDSDVSTRRVSAHINGCADGRLAHYSGQKGCKDQRDLRDERKI